MGYDTPNIDATVLTAWESAEKVCFDYLVFHTDSKAGYNAFIGDSPQDSNKKNVFTFMLSGGKDVQMRQCPTPNKYFQAYGFVAGIYESRKAALTIAGRIMNSMPAFWDEGDDIEAQGIDSNVDYFRLSYHPECFSRKEEGKKREWILLMEFECAYNYKEN